MPADEEDKPQPKPEPVIRPDRGTRTDDPDDKRNETRRGPGAPDPHTKRDNDD